MKPIKFIDKKDCTGCESCVTACSISCIEMHPDKRGFYYPMVDTTRCVNCNACIKACPVINTKINSDNPARRYIGCRAKDDNIIDNSSSGGLFSVIADNILKKGGVVCGAAFDNDFNVIHKVITNSEELHILRGSKYVQSTTHNALKELIKLNRNKIPLLFVGTPCQVAGARKILSKYNTANQLFIEVVCHGVPSPGVYTRYIKELQMDNSSLKLLNFRDKASGWLSYNFKATFVNGSELSMDGHKNAYVNGFIDNLYIRQCCTSCKFKNNNSFADITIGDFWGAENIHVNYSDDKGVSLAIINTDKGNQTFQEIKPSLKDIFETDAENAIRKNRCITTSTSYNPRTKRFYKFLKKNTVAKSVELAQKDTFTDLAIRSFKYRLGVIFHAKP